MKKSELCLKWKTTLTFQRPNCPQVLEKLYDWRVKNIFNDFGIWLLGNRIEFTCLYVPQGHYLFIKYCVAMKPNLICNFDCDRKSNFEIQISVQARVHLSVVGITVEFCYYRILCCRVDVTLVPYTCVIPGHIGLYWPKPLYMTSHRDGPVIVTDDERVLRIMVGVSKLASVNHLSGSFLVNRFVQNIFIII